MNCPYCMQDMGSRLIQNFCPRCGHKLIRCKTCGQILTQRVKFCPQDGTMVSEADQMLLPAPKSQSLGRRMPERQDGKPPMEPRRTEPVFIQKPTTGKIILLILLALVLVAAIGIGSFIIADNLLSSRNESVEAEQEVVLQQESVEVESALPEAEATQEAETEEVASPRPVESQSVPTAPTHNSPTAAETAPVAAPTQANPAPQSPRIPYVDNSYMDIDRNLSPDAFEICNEIPGVSFGYPKYLYNGVEQGEDYIYFYYDDGGPTYNYLYVSRSERSCSDKLARAKELQKELENRLDGTFFSMATDRANDGMARALVGGHYDKRIHQDVYTIVATDGRYEYTLEVFYIEDDPGNDLSRMSYIYDCVYRYCSFGGTSYLPRDYRTFLADDMGTKKR